MNFNSKNSNKNFKYTLFRLQGVSSARKVSEGQIYILCHSSVSIGVLVWIIIDYCMYCLNSVIVIVLYILLYISLFFSVVVIILAKFISVFLMPVLSFI